MGLTQDKMEFAAALGQAMQGVSAYHVASVAQKLCRYGATLRRIAEDMCNGPNYDYCRTDADRSRASSLWQEFQDTLPVKQERIQAKVIDLCAEIQGASAVFQNDPRGLTARLVINGREYGIPTS